METGENLCDIGLGKVFCEIQHKKTQSGKHNFDLIKVKNLCIRRCHHESDDSPGCCHSVAEHHGL